MGEIEEIRKILKDHENRLRKIESGNNGESESKKKAKAHKSKRDLLIELKTEGYFNKFQNIGAIITRLAEKNYVVSHGDLTKQLADLVKSGILERKKIDSKWSYKVK
jgi:hypothetical protein